MLPELDCPSWAVAVVGSLASVPTSREEAVAVEFIVVAVVEGKSDIEDNEEGGSMPKEPLLEVELFPAS